MAFKADASLIWKIENFDMCPNEWLCSPYILSGYYRIKLLPHGLEDSGNLSLYIKRSYVGLTAGDKECLEYRVSVLDREGEEIVRQTAKSVFGLGREEGFPRFIKREILLGERTSFLPSNVLTIRCDIRKIPTDEGLSHLDSREAELFSDQLARVLSSGLCSDVELKAEGESFKAHMIILKTRCNGLAKLLKGRKNRKNESLQVNVAALNLRSMLHYAYSGTFETMNLNPQLLLDLDRLDPRDLKNSLLNFGKSTLEATSTVVVSKLSFQWSIKDWNSLNAGTELVYPAYCLTENSWDKMEIALKAIENEDAFDNVQLVFKRLEGSDIAFIRTKIQVATNEGFFPLTECEHHFKNEKEWILLLEAWLIDFKLSDRSVELLFEISLSKFHSETCAARRLVAVHRDFDSCGVVKNYKLLQKSFKTLIENSVSLDGLPFFSDADVTLCAAKDEFRVHKVLLCARSPAFARMLDEGILKDKVVIEDICPKTLSHVLYYIYIGCVKNLNLQQTISLYEAARKYELPLLQIRCIDCIKSALDADSVGEILLFAHAHQEEDLKESVHNFVGRNPKDVLRSKRTFDALQWNLKVYPELFKGLLKMYPSIGRAVCKKPES